MSYSRKTPAGWILSATLMLFFFGGETALSQGCSDAGVCTINAIKTPVPSEQTQDFQNQLKIGYAFGDASFGVAIHTPYLEYTRSFGDIVSITAKGLFGVHHGENAVTAGLADVLFTAGVRVATGATLLAGVKIPFDKADRSKDGLPLPMAYQTSLGTTDLLLGVRYGIDDFGLAAAYQQPLAQNSNGFLPELYAPGTIDPEYLPTNEFERKADVLLRLSHRLAFRGNTWTLISSILPIYHTANDTYLSAAGVRTDLPGSRGLTLNLSVMLQYRLGKSDHLELSVGAPVISREHRPDGLSKFAVGMEYAISF